VLFHPASIIPVSIIIPFYLKCQVKSRQEMAVVPISGSRPEYFVIVNRLAVISNCHLIRYQM